MKAAVAMGVAGVLALSGCTGSDDMNSSGKPAVTVQVIKDARALPMKEMPWTKDLEEACECSIKWIETASDSWGSQKQASLAAGDVADVTIGGYGSGDWGNYGNLFLELTPELENMPNLSRAFEEAPLSRVVSTWQDKIYGAPKIAAGLMARASTHMFINKQWLDAVGLPVPTTWDELRTALEAFKTGDPNGNGEADEIPMDFPQPGTGGWGSFQANVLLGGSGISVSDSVLGAYAEDGEVKSYVTHPAYREFVEFLHGLYADGLISKEAFTHDWSQYTAGTKGEGATASVGMTWMWTPSDIFGTELADQYVTIPQLQVEAGATEDAVWSFNGMSLNYEANRVAIAADVANKEAALKLVDSIYTPDISVQMRYGSFDVAVKKNGEKDYTVLEPADKTKNSADWQFMNSLADASPGWVAQPGVKITLPSQLVEVQGVDAVYDDNFANMDFNQDLVFGTSTLTTEEATQYSLNSTGIGQTVMSKFAQWVTKGGIESEWDSYVADLERNNLEQQIEFLQTASDRYREVLQDNDVDLNAEFDPSKYQWVQNPDGTATLTQ
ncbi:MAG: putative transporter substrate binding component [Microbacterium sp.]|nr:putative transporter substrate binding component [Microbacterium sp.]